MTVMTGNISRRKDERVNLRVDAETKRLLMAAAEIKGTKLSDFLLSTAVNAAERLVNRPAVSRLDNNDFCRVLDALANPPEPTRYLVEAMRQGR